MLLQSGNNYFSFLDQLECFLYLYYNKILRFFNFYFRSKVLRFRSKCDILLQGGKMIGERLRELRNSKNLSMDDVESATGITDSRLYRIEKGITKHPSLDDISTLLNFYKIPLVSFLCQEGYCYKSDTPLEKIELLNDFEIAHIQDEIDFILKEKGMENGI